MVRVMGGAALAALVAVPATAGGLERSSQSVGILFEEGTYAEVTVGRIDPKVSGTQQVPLGTPGEAFPSSSGDITPAYNSTALGFKTSINDKVDLALVLDKPVGADVNYAPDTGYAYGGTVFALGGSTASIDSTALTMMARYKLNDSFSVYGGLRSQSVQGEVALFTGYTMDTDNSQEWGYLLGAAWEKPEIAARVALTYNSAITHTLNADEAQFGIGAFPTSSFKTEIPQSLNLEFQTGIAADTLLFGSVRWQEWSKTDITPTNYNGIYGGSLVDYEDDVITYNLGVGRRFNENWSAAITAGHEKSNGGFAGNLGPTDGFTSLGLAATYTRGNMKITGGVRHIWIGDAKTQAPSPYPAGTTLGEFKDNSGFAYGLKIGYSF